MDCPHSSPVVSCSLHVLTSNMAKAMCLSTESSMYPFKASRYDDLLPGKVTDNTKSTVTVNLHFSFARRALTSESITKS